MNGKRLASGTNDLHEREALSSLYNRRDLVRRAAALGISVPTLVALLGTGANAQGTPVGDPPEGDPILIGASVSTTGSNGRTGLYQQEAYLLWEAQKNASGGLLGRPVEMVIYDDQSDPTTGSRLYERLITEDEVDLVLGPYASGVTLAAAQITERYGYPMLVAGASAGEIWDSGFQYVFGVYSIAQDYFRDIILNIAPAQGYTTAAVIYEDAVFPLSTGEGAVAHCETAGIEVLVEETYPLRATDVSSILTRIGEAEPDMLIGGSYLPDSVLIMRQAKELGINVDLYAFSVGAAQPDFLDTLGEDANYVLGPSMWEPKIETTGNQEFLEAYRAMWDRDPDYHAATGYAGCQILEQALTNIGDVDLEALREELLQLTMTTILPGEYSVDETGRQTGHIPLTVQWQEGAKVIVAPEENRTGELQLPTPPWDERG
ncbi:MAG: amino acid ABC transporter substrate-binding protein [Chloroflexota bacterium]|jgi:branched-chain amino acid transport system substrate-binding protein|nr:amino acid ABC transporter substrate-binding protein [Chloroflexota bacterium]